jgi:hypothetical protein
MRTPTLILALTLAPALAAAQASTGAQVEARAHVQAAIQRADDRIPAGFSAEARARLEAMLERAQQENLPTAPMTDRMAEGRAKGASEAQIIAASSSTLAQLELAQSALIRAGNAHPTEEEVSQGSRRLDMAVQVLTELTARGVPVDQALAVISASATAQAGLRLGVGRKP